VGGADGFEAVGTRGAEAADGRAGGAGEAAERRRSASELRMSFGTPKLSLLIGSGCSSTEACSAAEKEAPRETTPGPKLAFWPLPLAPLAEGVGKKSCESSIELKMEVISSVAVARMRKSSLAAEGGGVSG